MIRPRMTSSKRYGHWPMNRKPYLFLTKSPAAGAATMVAFIYNWEWRRTWQFTQNPFRTDFQWPPFSVGGMCWNQRNAALSAALTGPKASGLQQLWPHWKKSAQ